MSGSLHVLAALIRWIDQHYLVTPFYGSRRMTAALRHTGHLVNRKRVQRLMRVMGLEALGPKPKTSRPAPQHRIYPYRLRGLPIALHSQGEAAPYLGIPGMPVTTAFHCRLAL